MKINLGQIIVIVVVIGLTWIFISMFMQVDKEGNICPIKDELTKLFENRSIIHRNFCIEKGLKPIHPIITANSCEGFCYQRNLAGCAVNMDKEVWCSDENNEIKRFVLE